MFQCCAISNEAARMIRNACYVHRSASFHTFFYSNQRVPKDPHQSEKYRHIKNNNQANRRESEVARGDTSVRTELSK